MDVGRISRELVRATPARLEPSALRSDEARHRDEAYPSSRAVLGAGLVAVALFLWLAKGDGGYAPTVWYPCSLAALALAAGIGVRGFATIPRLVAVAIGALVAFCALSFASIAWAQVRGDAWDGANRTLLYATVFSLFAVPRWRVRDATLVAGLLACGTAAIGVEALLVEGTSAFVGHRLVAPTGYANASAALFLGALPLAVTLAARREVPGYARALSLAAAGALVQLAVLAQSRGAAPAIVIAVAVLFVLTPDRRGCAIVAGLVVASTLACLSFLLDVYAAGDEAGFERALARERAALVVSCSLLALASLGHSCLDSRRARRHAVLGSARLRRVAAVGSIALAAAALAAGAVSAVTGGRESVRSTPVLEASRFARGVQSGRYHLWRIGFREVADHPLTGVGADNFAVDLARRDSGESLLYPHSSVLRAFSQTGLVGGALFVGFVAVALAAAVRKRRMDPRGSAIVATSCAAFVYWLVHSAVDWLWEIPAVTAPAFALLGLAVAMRKPEGRTLRPNRLSRSVLLVGVALAGASCALPALAAVEVERAAAEGKNDPQRAFARLDRARSLNALSERPDVVEAVLALRLGDTVRARSALTRAAARSPDDWWVHAELALLDAHAGRVVDARAQLRRADVLAPESPVLRLVRAALRSRGPSSSKALAELDARAIRSPLGRRAIECRPLLGLAGRCTVERGDG